MNSHPINRFATVLLIGTLCMTTVQAADNTAMDATPPPLPGPPANGFSSNTEATTIAQHFSGATAVETVRPIEGIDRKSLGTARALYKDLLMVLRSAQQHNEIDTRLGLNNANNIVDALYKPTAMHALLQQSAIIREDLKRHDNSIDRELWVPLQAELDGFRISLPAERYHAATSAIEQGKTAAWNSDRARARTALDRLERAVATRFALLPLSKIRGDLVSAESTLDPAPPYWQGISEAMRSALASIRWVTTLKANNWIAAYEDAVRAVKALSDGPEFARRWLRVTSVDLQALPGGSEFAEQALKLSRRDPITADAVYDLIDGIGGHVSAIGNP
ncbi:MAG: hypothetical protein H6955_18890 [Chromatiaceae bacterium]|nr:hypothetical protein [Chromatiaceae bacterium]